MKIVETHCRASHVMRIKGCAGVATRMKQRRMQCVPTILTAGKGHVMIINGNVIEILMVEDNPTDAELALRALKKSNLANKVFWVKDGAEALDFIFAAGKYSNRDINVKPKVILLDLRLPKVDGMEVLRRIRSDERTKLIPVVILTSSREDKDIVESYRLGANSYIVKPVEFENFSKTVSELGYYWLLLNKEPTEKI